MHEALSITWQSLKDYWDEFLLLMLLNLLWSLIVALPLVVLFTLGRTNLLWAMVLGLVLAFLLPIVSGGICFVTNQVSRGKAVGWGTFADGLRRYWAKSLVVALINLVALILFVINLQFYGAILQGGWTRLVLIVWLGLGLYWLLVQVFWFPMILELESEKILPALRSALLMVLVTPRFTLTLAVLIALVVVLSIALTVPAVLLMITLLMLIANHATRSRLAFAQRKLDESDASEE